MANPTGFLQYPRVEIEHRPIEERIRDWHEIDRDLLDETLNQQAARCMDCGVPFCHGVGCPLRNRIPEFNDLVYRRRWREAAENLHSTNNFPEITGRVCPAPCEAACTLATPPRGGEHQEHRAADRRVRVRRRLDRADSPEDEDRQESGRDRLRARRARRRAAACPARARRRRLRAERPPRRIASLRNSRLQARKADSRPPARTDDARRRRVRDERQRRRRYFGRPFAPPLPCDRAVHGRRPAARASRRPAPICRACISRWIICRSRTAAWRATPSSPPRRSTPATSTSS